MSQPIPLSELYAPLTQMYAQITLYENLYQEIEQMHKNQIRQKNVIEKLQTMLDKKQQQNQEKALLEDLYQRTNLTKEQASLLTSLDHPVNAEFFRVYQILEEQELLALEIKKLEKDGEPSALRSSFLQNIEEIRQAALSKVVQHLKTNYDSVSIDELKTINQLFKQKVREPIIFVFRYKFSSQFAHFIFQLNQPDILDREGVIVRFLASYKDELSKLMAQLEDIPLGEDALPQFIDNLTLDYFQLVEQQLKFVTDYYQMFTIAHTIQEISELFKAEAIQMSSLAQIARVLQLSCQLKEKTALNICTVLSKIRYNIGQPSSYKPFYDFFEKAKEFMARYSEGHHREIIEAVYTPLITSIKQKLQQNQYNRSSKIFSINALQIIDEQSERLMGQFKQAEEFLSAQKAESQQFVDQLLNKLALENTKEVIESLKLPSYVSEVTKNIALSSENFKRYLRVFASLEEKNVKDELYFETGLILNDNLRYSVVSLISNNLTKEYYEPLYNHLLKYSQANQEFTQEVIQELCKQHGVTNKDVPKVPKYVRDPESFKLWILNSAFL